MKKQINMHNSVHINKRTLQMCLITALVLVLCDSLIKLNPFGVFSTLLLLQSPLSSDVALGYVLYNGLVLAILVAATGIILKMLRLKDALPHAFIAVAIFYFITRIVSVYAGMLIPLYLATTYVVAVVALALVTAILQRVTFTKGRMVAAIGIMVVLVVSQLYIVNVLSEQRYTEAYRKARDAVKVDVGFKVYYPVGGDSSGFTFTKPITNNYPVEAHAEYKPTVVFNIDDGSNDIKVVQGAAPDNQLQFVNDIDRCDVKGLYYAFNLRQPDVSPLDHLCDPAFVTPSGKKVYRDETSARDLYFTSIGKTDIFFEWQSATYVPGWAIKTDATIAAVIELLEEIDQSKITLGYDVVAPVDY